MAPKAENRGVNVADEIETTLELLRKRAPSRQRDLTRIPARAGIK